MKVQNVQARSVGPSDSLFLLTKAAHSDPAFSWPILRVVRALWGSHVRFEAAEFDYPGLPPDNHCGGFPHECERLLIINGHSGPGSILDQRGSAVLCCEQRWARLRRARSSHKERSELGMPGGSLLQRDTGMEGRECWCWRCTGNDARKQTQG